MSLGRASAMIAAGTLASRATGLLRTIVLVAAIGAIGRASDAFATANQLPNSIYAVISAGVLTGVIVPQVVRVSARHDGGHDFLAKLLTLGTVLMAAVTVIAFLSAPALVRLFASQYTADQHVLATFFAYWCIPQLFFYGMFALIGEILNARRIFAPYAWAPIVNNVVSIIGFLLFIVLFGADHNDVGQWTPVMVALLAGTATLGVIAQTVVLLQLWRRAGIPLRFDFRWRGMGLGQMRKLAVWTFLTTLVGQLAGIVQQQTISAASGSDASVFASQNAWLVYMVPYSVIVLAIGTPYFTRLSEHAAAGRDAEVKRDIGQSIRILGLFIFVALAAVVAAALPASRIFSNNTPDAVAVAPVLIAYLCSLLPMAVLFIVQRTFYAYGDARTPFLFTVIQAIIIVMLTLLVSYTVPVEHLTAAVALAQSLAGIVQVTVATVLLRRKLGPLDLGPTWRALCRFALMAIPAGAAGVWLFFLLGGTSGWMMQDKFWGALGACVIAAACGLVYLLLLTLFRAPELRIARDALRRMRP
jgi:putative peptidoglycan lipid II flippase